MAKPRQTKAEPQQAFALFYLHFSISEVGAGAASGKILETVTPVSS